jgi:precorrin-6B methylase 1
METDSTEGNRSRQTVLYIVGAGIRFPEHLTIQTIEVLSGCKRICTNLPASTFASLPEDLRTKCESLGPLYQDKRHRAANYHDVAQAVLDAGEREFPVAWMTQGHPIVFDSVSQLLLSAGRARGWQVSVLPAISSLDTILAEIGYDPASGFFVHEATALVRRQVPLQPAITTVLLQPSLFGSDVAHLTPDWRPDLAPLRDHLLQFYAKEQECGFIRSSSKADDESTICWTKVGDLSAVTFEALANSSLLLPSATIERLSEMSRANSRPSRSRNSSKSVATR